MYFSAIFYEKALTAEDTEDTEEVQKREKIGVRSWVTVREPMPPTFSAMDHHSMKGFNSSIFLFLHFLRVLRVLRGESFVFKLLIGERFHQETMATPARRVARSAIIALARE
jgi:hypothetical protein